MVADIAIGEAPAPDIFILPGGLYTHEHITNPDLLEKIAYQGRRAKRIVCVCRSAYLAAASGLLDGKRATLHWMDSDHFCGAYPQVSVEPDAFYIQYGNV